MDKIMRLKFNFKNKNGTEVFGEIYLPVILDKIYKASKVILTSGFFDIKYRNNFGDAATEDRKYKDLLVEKMISTDDPELFQISKPILMELPKDGIGFVKLTSLLSGYHTNNKAKIFTNEDVPSNIEGYPLGRIFQRLKTSPNKFLEPLPIITFNEFCDEYPNYLKKLVYKVNENISTTEIGAKDD